jgi:branched-chain amino acid transport system ATP-binding protein
MTAVAPPSSPPALEIEGLWVSYGSVPAVRQLALTVGAGEIVGLIGPNGAGKSTTLHTIVGLVPARSGDIRVNGTSIVGRKPEAIARGGVSLVPEGRRIFAELTVEENLRLGLVARKNRADSGSDFGWIEELFPVVQEFRARQAGTLSGGQQQQLAIARALVARPSLLLLDEPSLGLAPTTVDVLLDALVEIRARGVTMLLVEQRAQRTVALADRTYVMTNGEIRMTLTPADADDTDRIVAAYMAS